ncbi:MAG: S1C family serine protease [Salinispira sp.]
MLILLGMLLALAVTFGFGLIKIPAANVSEISSEKSDPSGGSESAAAPTSSAYSELNLQSNNGYIVPAFDGRSNFTIDENNTIEVYEKRNEAVVNVSTETISYSFFFEPLPQEGGVGSGTVIDRRGYVLTNYHVIRESVKIFVTLADGERVEAELIGADPENDLAVLKFEPDGRELQTIPLGNSDALRIGQKVLAIGNPFSFDRTLTTGVVSGLGRPIRSENGMIIQGMIQTDASINPGNSGGPLLNSQGSLIGVNTVIYSLSGGSVGVGFAVPVSTVKRVLPDLLEFGKVNRGWIDISPIQLFPQLVTYARIPLPQGILVSAVQRGGNADNAGIRGGSRNSAVRYGNTIIYLGGDIITEVDGTVTHSIAQLYEALEDNKPGDVVTVVYYRGSRRIETEVELSQRPEQFAL